MLSQKIKEKAKSLNYTAVGIIPAKSFDEYTRELDNRSELYPQSKELYNNFRDFGMQEKMAFGCGNATH
ncbi:MAG: glypican family protein [Oscillospiraceae bacterium]|jgi:epoxyqueuosine reductase QueG|nr:glypican family protein [Oscillospiraceae bacterium]